MKHIRVVDDQKIEVEFTPNNEVQNFERTVKIGLVVTNQDNTETVEPLTTFQQKGQIAGLDNAILIIAQQWAKVKMDERAAAAQEPTV